LGSTRSPGFRADFAPLLEVVWIGTNEHERGLDLLEESNLAKLSLVDAVSFVVARDHDVRRCSRSILILRRRVSTAVV
jgi:hypothetical protein